MNTPPDFKAFPKMARLSREVIVTEKIDGTNASILITPEGDFFTGSRTQWITPAKDNHGFSAWAHAHKGELMQLGPGLHFGEWWGSGIQRGYGLQKGEKRFSLFNVIRWCLNGTEPQRIVTGDPRIEKWQDVLPACCGLVPILGRGIGFAGEDHILADLEQSGSWAAPGFMKPEGIVVWHTAANTGFKKTIEKDDQPKSITP